MRSRLVHLLVAVAAVGLVTVPGASADDAAVCTWGGTVAQPTGTFTAQPGLRTVPSATPIAFRVTGELAGPPARCAGTMTVQGFDIPTSRCAFGIGDARVYGVPGVASALTVGVLHYNRQTLVGPDGRIVGSADVEVASTGVVQAREACQVGRGRHGGKVLGPRDALPGRRLSETRHRSQ